MLIAKFQMRENEIGRRPVGVVTPKLLRDQEHLVLPRSLQATGEFKS
jgi:hypothetical protein